MPYSDNLYSIDSDDEFPDLEPLADHGAYPVPSPQQSRPLASPETGPEEDDQDPDHALSPADGNFPTTHTYQTGNRSPRTSSHVPHVPNILVRDPSLEQGSTAESKAREARQEQQAADSNLNSPAVDADTDTSPVVPQDDQSPSRATSPRSSSAYTPTSPTSSRSTHYQPSTAGAYSAYAPSTASHNTSHVPRRSIYTASSPFLPREAPPAYTPSRTATSTYTGSTSPTSPTASSTGQSDFPRNYQTFSQVGMGRVEETRGLLAPPESMGGPSGDDFGDVTPAWRDRVRRRVPYLNWRNCRYAAVCLVLLLLTVGFLVSGITSVKKDLKPKDPSDSDPPSRSPVLEPPHMDYPPYDGDLPWSEDNQCSGKPTERVAFSFPVSYGPGRSFSLVQDVAEPADTTPYRTHNIRVSGDVVIRRTGQGTPEPSFSLEFLKNDDSIQITTDWDRDTQALHITTPRIVPGLDDAVSWPCVSIRVTLWVPGDAVLDSLTIDNVHLGIRLMDNLALQVAQFSKLSSVVGPIVAATDGTDKADNLVEDGAPDYFQFDSRVIEVKSTSAPITGYWPLYDYLGLYNIAGKIKVRVSPREEKKDAPKPATLYVKSLSGTIEVWEPVDKAQSALTYVSSTDLVAPTALRAEKYIPPRDYRANIQSTSGKIKAAVAFSSACRIHSTSGDSMVELLPVLHSVSESDTGSNLETSTTSGTTKLQVLEPLWIGEDGKSYLAYPPISSDGPRPPSPPSPPSPPAAPRDTAPSEDEIVPIGQIGTKDPYQSLPPTLLPPTTSPLSLSLSRSDSDQGQSPPSSLPALRCLQSRHSSTSATMHITYPASWEGELDLGSTSGSLHVEGEGVKVIRDGEDWPGFGRHLIARKGEGDGGSVAGLKTTSGGIRVVVGE
ncbi:hypothetical protein CONLIGDRAFT_684332 [Coniochaeta ligniaria NRRL 30616]|uniref:Adhesin domain-containing protein n=1 Tax=Coniochaeta ligniaria NRRL 30616 TaxID=1408157 RepID=A0A1J7IDM8_9PEZI|nr:hypothetical protein CONLIGDRAFT_684332 [Coniochaeta ligniaria NRRL 30616]